MELTAISFVLTLISLGAAWWTTTEALELAEWKRRIRAIEGGLVAAELVADHQLQMIRRIEGRQTAKQPAAAKRTDPNAEPDSKTDPEGWKLWKNRQLVQQRGLIQ